MRLRCATLEPFHNVAHFNILLTKVSSKEPEMTEQTDTNLNKRYNIVR